MNKNKKTSVKHTESLSRNKRQLAVSVAAEIRRKKVYINFSYTISPEGR